MKAWMRWTARALLASTLIPQASMAIDLETMTPLKCDYAKDADTISGKSECGDFKICNMDVVCSYVDNAVLADEFKGDADAAKKAFDRDYHGTLTHSALGHIWYTEFAGGNPRFIQYSARKLCPAVGGGCGKMPALACRLDKSIIRSPLDLKKQFEMIGTAPVKALNE